ncbi:MAG TPA: KTSC domain-containing protein [Sphingomicrobium sp.]
MPSHVIQSFDYRPERRELHVTFTTGRRYLYLGVPQAKVDAMRAAFSKGRYFNAQIRPFYPYRELGREVT